MEIQLKNKELQREIKLKKQKIEELENENEDLKNKLKYYMEELGDTLQQLLIRTNELAELQRTIELSKDLEKLCSKVKKPLFWNSDKLLNSAIDLLEETDKLLKE